MVTDYNTPPPTEPKRKVWPWVASAIVLVLVVFAIAVPNASRMAVGTSDSTTSSAPAAKVPATDETTPPAPPGRPN